VCLDSEAPIFFKRDGVLSLPMNQKGYTEQRLLGIFSIKNSLLCERCTI
jgi:hypothetical protein